MNIDQNANYFLEQLGMLKTRSSQVLQKLEKIPNDNEVKKDAMFLVKRFSDLLHVSYPQDFKNVPLQHIKNMYGELTGDEMHGHLKDLFDAVKCTNKNNFKHVLKSDESFYFYDEINCLQF